LFNKLAAALYQLSNFVVSLNKAADNKDVEGRGDTGPRIIQLDTA
jgi:hypothetical protein